MKCSKWFVLLTPAILSAIALPVCAQEKKGSPDEEAIMKKAEAFVEAFHKGDAKAVAAFWTPDGDYVDIDGRLLKGREAIEKAFSEYFAENKGSKVRIDVDSLRMVTPDVAVEDGTSSVIPADNSPPSRARYTITHVKKDGQWYLSSVRDSVYAPETNYSNLRSLDWVIGRWTTEPQDGGFATASFEWADTQNFVISSFTTNFKNVTLTGGQEWIGWDPVAKRIRSWIFDRDGGFGEGSWSSEGGKLVIKVAFTSRDGKKMEATNTVTRIDANTVSWQSKDRKADGKPLPDIADLKLKRQVD